MPPTQKAGTRTPSPRASPRDAPSTPSPRPSPQRASAGYTAAAQPEAPQKSDALSPPLEQPGSPNEPPATFSKPKPAHPDNQDRVKMECPGCGYKSFPQWMNNQAHCLKCDKVLKTRGGAHGELNNGPATTATRRAPGEASTYKQNPSSAMESKSGICTKSPDGQHNWKFGKCSYCGKAEGVLATSAGSCGAGGKCAFKFSKCTKCGRSEF